MPIAWRRRLRWFATSSTRRTSSACRMWRTSPRSPQLAQAIDADATAAGQPAPQLRGASRSMDPIRRRLGVLVKKAGGTRLAALDRAGRHERSLRASVDHAARHGDGTVDRIAADRHGDRQSPAVAGRARSWMTPTATRCANSGRRRPNSWRTSSRLARATTLPKRSCRSATTTRSASTTAMSTASARSLATPAAADQVAVSSSDLGVAGPRQRQRPERAVGSLLVDLERQRAGARSRAHDREPGLAVRRRRAPARQRGLPRRAERGSDARPAACRIAIRWSRISRSRRTCSRRC